MRLDFTSNISAMLLHLGCLFTYKFCVNASTNLYRILVLKILNGQIPYLNKIGIGSLLNVVSKDVDILESSFPQNLQGIVLNFFLLLSSIFTICYATPIFLVFLAPLALLYYFLQVRETFLWFMDISKNFGFTYNAEILCRNFD